MQITKQQIRFPFFIKLLQISKPQPGIFSQVSFHFTPLVEGSPYDTAMLGFLLLTTSSTYSKKILILQVSCSGKAYFDEWKYKIYVTQLLNFIHKVFTKVIISCLHAVSILSFWTQEAASSRRVDWTIWPTSATSQPHDKPGYLALTKNTTNIKMLPGVVAGKTQFTEFRQSLTRLWTLQSSWPWKQQELLNWSCDSISCYRNVTIFFTQENKIAFNHCATWYFKTRVWCTAGEFTMGKAIYHGVYNRP